MKNSLVRWLQSYKTYIFFTCLILLEFFLFKQYVQINIADFYPKLFDQASYLPNFYLTYENIKQYGWIDGLGQSPTLATGMLFPFQTALAFFILGPSRFSALLVNFIYFVVLQLSCYFTAKFVFKKESVAFLFLGVLLSVLVPFTGHGGDLFDVRIDFIAFCLYGVFICSVIRCSFFLDRKWTYVAAIIASLTILLRTLTIIYLFGIIFFIGSYFLWQFIRSHYFHHKDKASFERLINLSLFSLFVTVMTVPWVWMGRFILYGYYVVGHVLNGEKYIRALEVGVKNLGDTISYYPNNLLFSQIGLLAFSICIMFVVIYTILYFVSPQQQYSSANENKDSWRIGWIFLWVSLLVPLFALTLDQSKSPIVASVMVVPTLWLFFWWYALVDSRINFTQKISRWFNLIVLIVLIVGIGHAVRQLSYHYSKRQVRDLSNITRMYLDIGDYAVSKKWSSIHVAFDQVCDYLTSGGISVLYYEMRNKFISVAVELVGGTIFPITKQQALDSLQKTDVLVLNLDKYPQSFYPFNHSVEELRPVLRQYAQKHLHQLGEYEFRGSVYRVYVRE